MSCHTRRSNHRETLPTFALKHQSTTASLYWRHHGAQCPRTRVSQKSTECTSGSIVRNDRTGTENFRRRSTSSPNTSRLPCTSHPTRLASVDNLAQQLTRAKQSCKAQQSAKRQQFTKQRISARPLPYRLPSSAVHGPARTAILPQRRTHCAG